MIGWSFGSFVTQSHMVRHGSASAYVLMGTVAQPGALANVEHELAIFEPECAARPGRRLVGARGDRRDARAGEAAARRPDAVPRRRPDGPARRGADRRRPGRLPAGRAAALRCRWASTGCSTCARSLRSVHEPTLILSGANDRTTPAASAHELGGVAAALRGDRAPGLRPHGALRAAGCLHRRSVQLPRRH